MTLPNRLADFARTALPLLAFGWAALSWTEKLALGRFRMEVERIGEDANISYSEPSPSC